MLVPIVPNLGNSGRGSLDVYKVTYQGIQDSPWVVRRIKNLLFFVPDTKLVAIRLWQLR